MKKSRFSEEQRVKILREADKVPVSQVAKKHGHSEQTLYARRKRFGTLEAVDVKRLRQLKVARSTMGYESKLTQRDAPVVAAMPQCPRFGCRRLRRRAFLGSAAFIIDMNGRKPRRKLRPLGFMNRSDTADQF